MQRWSRESSNDYDLLSKYHGISGLAFNVATLSEAFGVNSVMVCCETVW